MLFYLNVFVLQVARKPKVSNFPQLSLQENVRRLNISMHDQFFNQIFTARSELIDNIFTIEFNIFIYYFLKSASLAVIGDNIAIILSVVHIVEFDNVRMIKSLEYFYLVL